MKKCMSYISLAAMLFVLGLVAAPKAEAAWTGVAVSSLSVTTSSTTLGSPVVSGSISIKSLTLSNSGATAQTVTFYSNATSTTAVTQLFSVVLPAAAGFYRPFGDQDLYDLFNVTDLTLRKSSASTDVYMVINYPQ